MEIKIDCKNIKGKKTRLSISDDGVKKHKVSLSSEDLPDKIILDLRDLIQPLILFMKRTEK